MAGTRRQTRLSLSAKPKPEAPTPPISKLLSQYELLGSLCQHLSSADIIHLAATSKEHWQSVASSPVILNGLIAHSSCDGRGIAAQARVFGYWGGDATETSRPCRGKDAKPCVDCGAMMCRFHIRYPENIPAFNKDYSLNGWDPTDRWKSILWARFWAAEERKLGHDINKCVVVKKNVTHEVELTRALWMLNNKIVRYCEDCEPLFAQIDWDIVMCRCTLYSRFLQPWRCIPCVQNEETNLVASQQKYKLTFRPAERRPWSYYETTFCAFGKQVIEQEAIDFCRWCGRIEGWWEPGDASRLARIQAQLGTCVDDRSGDPILSQLG